LVTLNSKKGINKVLINQTHSDYSLTIDNQSDTGLGLRIRAGLSGSKARDTHGSLAILSVADKHNDNKFIVKASGEVVAYHNLTVKNVHISGSNITTHRDVGTLSLNNIKWPAMDGTANQLLKTDGSGNLSFTSVIEFAQLTTIERDALNAPADGSVIFNTTDSKLQVKVSRSWINLH